MTHLAVADHRISLRFAPHRMAPFGARTRRSASRADDYPSRPIKIIVPFGAGGPTDVYTRAIAEETAQGAESTVVDGEPPGRGTTIGTDLVAKATPTATPC